MEGWFPRRAFNLPVLERYNLHQEVLWENWSLARERKALRRIDPLEEH